MRQGRTHKIGKTLVTGSAVVCGCLFAAAALAAGSFTDAAGDNTPALDISSATVSQSQDGRVAIDVSIGNHASLPDGSRIALWFDLDNNPQTGDEGDEALVTYSTSNGLAFWRWSKGDLVEQEPTGMTASFGNSMLTYSGPMSAFDNVRSFGLLVITRGVQDVDDERIVGWDALPELGRLEFQSPGPATLSDAIGDVPLAPDIKGVRVGDAKDGMVRFAISTSDTVVPQGRGIRLMIDRDLLGEGGGAMERSEVLIEYSGGKVRLRRWDPVQREWADDQAPTRVRAAATGNGTLVIEVHRSELDDVARFAFAVESWQEDEDGDFDAADIAPDEFLWNYKLSHRPPLRLIGDGVFGTPARPSAGKPFTVNLPVRRSDTSRPITSGTVECTAFAGQRKLHTTAALKDGVAMCALRVPRNAMSIRGAMTVRSAGKVLTGWFSGAVDFGGGVGK